MINNLSSDLELSNKNDSNGKLLWQSIDHNGDTWFECEFKLPSLTIKRLDFETKNNKKIAKILQFVLKEAKKLNLEFLQVNQSSHIKTKLTFDKNWGLGSSSTLINNIATWANVDAFKLQFKTFGGSAYDIACAQNNVPILYQLEKQIPKIEKVTFNPLFKNQLFFVHLNKKQNSRKAIKEYQKFKENKTVFKKEISEITNHILNEQSLKSFEKLIGEHENIISKMIDIKPVQTQFFKDYFGQIKSLGAWGGDFILATGNEDTPKYFKQKGFQTIIPFEEMIL